MAGASGDDIVTVSGKLRSTVRVNCAEYRLAVGPLEGETDAERMTVPENPFTLWTVNWDPWVVTPFSILMIPVPPTTKSGTATFTMTTNDRDSEPLVPVTFIE